MGKQGALGARRCALVATLTATLLTPIAFSTSSASAAPATRGAVTVANGVRLNAVEAQLLAKINTARVNRRMPALKVAPGYTDVARRWAATQAKRRLLAHNPDMRAQLVQSGGKDWRVLGENVGFGADATSLFNAYWNSPLHRANILNPDYRYIGIGWVALANGTGYNTQNFVSAYSSSYGPTRVAMRP